jgi:hypothetical protein
VLKLMKWRLKNNTKDQWNKLVLQKDKQDWATLSQTSQKKGKRPKFKKLEVKKEILELKPLKSKESLGIILKTYNKLENLEQTNF